MPIIPNGFAQLNHVIKLAGDPDEMIVTMGLRFDAITFAEVPTIMESAFDVFCDRWLGVMTSDYTAVRIDSYSNFGGENLVYTTTSAPRAGLQGTTPVPQNCAYLIKKLTAAGGRTGRGRMYLPGVPENVVDAAGGLIATRIQDLNDHGALYVTNLAAINGVASASLLHSQIGDLPNDIIGMTGDSRIATQRRRLR